MLTRLETALAERVRDLAPRQVGDLLTEMQRTHGVDREVAASAMWDAAEAGHVTYGTDGWVRPGPQADRRLT